MEKTKTKRVSYGKLPEVMEIPYLLDLQVKAYEIFLKKGIKQVLKEVFPISSYDESYVLEFVNNRFDSPKYSIEECQRRGMTYSSPLKVTLRLKAEGNVREQEIYFGDIPLMSSTGSFIINGAERVIVSQLQRSPGVCYEKRIQLNEKRLFAGRIIPYRGAWVEFEFDPSDILYVYIDRRKKMLATTFLRCIGYVTDEEILGLFYEFEKVKVTNEDKFVEIVGRRLAQPLVDNNSGEILADTLTELKLPLVKKAYNAGVKEFILVKTEGDTAIINSIEKDPRKTEKEALIDIYRRIRPGEPPTLESAKTLVYRLFFDPKRYDLSNVGRFKLNKKLGLDVPEKTTVLRKEDIVEVIRRLIKVKNGIHPVDDIDHLGNRRVRSVGELVQNQLRIGIVRMERSVRERMAIHDMTKAMPHNLINSKVVSSIIKDFFQRSQLSQFMDQVNPLAELTHKRRLSALGPGGLNRERAGFEVRDVHHTHYGRICPIETPEGPNIGLISSLGTYAKLNKYGFIETPYRKVENGVVTNKIEYLSADVEDGFKIAQASAKLDAKGKFVEKEIPCRYKDDYPIVSATEVDYIDVSAKQLVSAATSLIPFLEHDDANRALMGSNMQRQAVPLLQTESPLVGTGMEEKVGIDSGAVVTAEYAGIVKYMDAESIVIESSVGKQEYKLRKFIRSNAGTCINQRPLVKIGDKIKKKQIIADGVATSNGELALGRNVMVAFMPWGGYNFEDAILISERVVKEDIYTSVHIEEFSTESRETKLGEEEITRDIPNVNEELIKNLDNEGIIRIGAEVKPGDILVGKVTPKSETELSPEEKLLRAIFGEKAGDVRDASLTVPSGVEGVVIDTKVFFRKDKARTEEEKLNEKQVADRVTAEYDKEIKEVDVFLYDKLKGMILNKKFEDNLFNAKTGEILVKANYAVKEKHLKELILSDFEDAVIKDEKQLTEEFKTLMMVQKIKLEELNDGKRREVERIYRGDELPPGVIKMVKVYVAGKRKLAVGDKMAGRHGNKGVVAKILPEEDMPFLEDGTPVDMVLNPLGVPSRMNVGQIFEIHLGWAAKMLGMNIATPVFDGAKEEEITDLLINANKEHPYMDKAGVTYLYDGRTGERFDQKVTVGYMYMLKLAHLVNDKIHARSIGPYSLVTQQPLGGKAQFGGQRFGEMEVWALEAYGAAYTLQELLTVKSDDVAGRTRMYESIVKGDNSLQSGVPESFNVLIKELQSLGLDIEIGKSDQIQLEDKDTEKEEQTDKKKKKKMPNKEKK
jgi:DNA-directed RNA polymerase subunit beta